MSTDLNAALCHVVDRTRVSEIQSCVIPSPPDAKAYPGNHLLINCLCCPSVLAQGAARALALVRLDTVALLRCLVTEQAIRNIESVCLTFLAPAEPPGSTMPSNDTVSLQRVYRYSVLSSALGVEPEAIHERFLLSNAFFLQESGVQGVRELIESEPQRKTALKKELWES